MINTKELRRLAQKATPGPWKMLPVGDGRQKFAVADSEFLSILTVTDEGGGTFGTVYDDDDARFIAAANPAAISELLDRLEAAEKERDALHAKIEAMEKQEPVGKFIQHPSHGMWEQDGYGDNPDAKPLYTLPGAQQCKNCNGMGDRFDPSGEKIPCDLCESHLEEIRSLVAEAAHDIISGSDFWLSSSLAAKKIYALPGAQPAPSVPEGWQLVPTAESRHPGIYKMLGALHAADNTPGMSEWEGYRAMLAVAPEVKPCP